MSEVDQQEQLTALRGLYEGLSLQHDDVVRENERLRAAVDELRARYVEAEARREELEREVDQLIDADRAVRLLVVRARAQELTGEGVGFIAADDVRAAQMRGSAT
jgi:predicted nuclease with TOPRIM domain